MLDNASVSVYIPIIAKNDEGTPIKTWGYLSSPAVDPVETFRADVQPANLSQAQLEQWGLSNRQSDLKKMFYYTSAYVKLNNRVHVVSDIPNDGTGYYEIRGTNHWPIHGECLLVPVQGEA